MRLLTYGLAVAAALTGAVCMADEGMWTFDNPPTALLQKKYGFTPTKQWLDHLRLASVRFNDGGSGSFVSPNGLVLTNHHVASFQLQKASTPQKNYVKDGFYAATESEEMKTTDLEVNVLESMENVTTRVLGAVKPGMNDKQALDARQAEIAKISKESLDRTGLRSDVVDLYHGGEYWLYRYNKYTDVRIVFAPEKQTAFFGGDPDNFTYPRYDLDMALFRVYENGKPIHSPSYLKWNSHGASDGELVFVSGHPGSTQRDLTLAQLETERNSSLPAILTMIDSRLKALRAYSSRGAEQEREAETNVFGLENSRKALTGEYQGLQNARIWSKKVQEEQEFRQAVRARPEIQAKYGDAWDAIAAAEQKLRGETNKIFFRRTGSELAARTVEIVEYVQEIKKPDGQRLPGFHDAQLASLRFQLLSPAPVYIPMEEALMTVALSDAVSKLGSGDPYVAAALGGRTPAEAAKAALATTKLTDPAARKALLQGGEAAVNASSDPLVVFARNVEPSLRAVTVWRRDNIEAVEVPAGEKIERARFAIYGKSTYPDATFTLRLSYGTVKGYPMNGTVAPYKTTFYGLYGRSADFDDKPPFNLTDRWVNGRTALNLSTPLDFVNTCDIIGGNSGSPVVNRKLELVGLIFDGNIESLVGAFLYDEATNRAVAVHTGGMMEALRTLYHTDRLVNELEGR